MQWLLWWSINTYSCLILLKHVSFGISMTISWQHKKHFHACNIQHPTFIDSVESLFSLLSSLFSPVAWIHTMNLWIHESIPWIHSNIWVGIEIMKMHCEIFISLNSNRKLFFSSFFLLFMFILYFISSSSILFLFSWVIIFSYCY